ncbi:hypothetical protein [Candidatus Poriferisocius sp.]|uniref:hypothetical protein n=1 Tax=Candidatus Poriferisocius sp. TaxID=3101276 RepID=UPI003B021AD7
MSGFAAFRAGGTVSLAVAVLAAAVVVPAVSAPVVMAQAVQDVEERDSLIANQENLLNTYRCLFGVDVEVVPGGCPDPDRISPGAAPQNPTQQDIDARDQLIQNQEALLNVYRCRFDVDTQIVPGGCVDGRPFDPTAPLPVPDSSQPPARPTGYTPGDSGPGFTVDANGRVRLSRLMTADEGISTYVAAGYSSDIAATIWAGPTSGQGSVGGARSSDGASYPYSNPIAGVSGQRMAEWAQACVTAFEDAGVPAYARTQRDNPRPIHRMAANPGGLVARCTLGVLNSGAWNLVSMIFGVDPNCIVDHMIEFMPVVAGRAMGRSFADMGHHRLDFWWGNHCQIRVLHPLGAELVIGPFGTTGNWTEVLYERTEAELLGDWAPWNGTACHTGRATRASTDINSVLRPRIDILAMETLRVINSGRSCWHPGTAPWTTADLDQLGISYVVSSATVASHHPAGTLSVFMRFLPDSHPTEQRLSPPAPAYWTLAGS